MEIDYTSDVPLHAQVADAIRAQIDAGVLRPGDELPTEGDMEHAYGVGQATIRRVLSNLAAEGRILRRKGYRAQVMPEVEREVVKVQRGSSFSSRMPTPAERRRMGIPVGVPLVEITYGSKVSVHAADRCDFRVS